MAICLLDTFFHFFIIIIEFLGIKGRQLTIVLGARELVGGRVFPPCAGRGRCTSGRRRRHRGRRRR